MTIHIAGIDVRIGPYLRQRCAWCGSTLLDYDLSLMAVPMSKNGIPLGGPAVWPFGAFVAIEGERQGAARTFMATGSVVEPLVNEDGTLAVPDGCCASVDPSITA